MSFFRFGVGGSTGLLISSAGASAVTFAAAPPPPPPEGGPTASLSATRLSGTAPLAVLFDATASTLGDVGTYPIHDLEYAFDFDDVGSGTWAVSSQSKNTQTGGPLASHVFETPGTYTVSVTATDSLARTSAPATVEVVVSDPATTYSGTATVVVSTSANYAGAPAGAATVTSLAAAAPLTGKRIMLRRGESFGALSFPYGTENCQVVPIGTGDKPQVSSVSIGSGRPNVLPFPTDIVVRDLDIDNGLTQEASASRLLIMGCDMNDVDTTANNRIDFAGALSYWAVDDPTPILASTDFYYPREIFFVENSIIGTSNADSLPFGNCYGMGSRVVLLGNDIGAAEQHTVRLYVLHKGVIAHNQLRGISNDGTRHALKLNAGGLDAYGDGFVANQNIATSQVVIANNLFGDATDNNDWTVSAAPQNNLESSDEGLEDVIMENNRFIQGIRTSQDIVTVGRRITVRGSTRQGAGGAIRVDHLAGLTFPDLPAEWRGPYFVS